MPLSVILAILFFLAIVLLWRRSQAANDAAEEVMRTVAPDIDGLRSLIAAGHIIAAIKLARRITGQDLKASKELIEALQRGEVTELPAAASTGAENAAATDPELLAHLRAGRTIEATKRWRHLTGAGLAGAKDAVDALAHRVGGG